MSLHAAFSSLVRSALPALRLVSLFALCLVAAEGLAAAEDAGVPMKSHDPFAACFGEPCGPGGTCPEKMLCTTVRIEPPPCEGTVCSMMPVMEERRCVPDDQVEFCNAQARHDESREEEHPCASDADCPGDFRCDVFREEEGNTDALCLPYPDHGLGVESTGDPSQCWGVCVPNAWEKQQHDEEDQRKTWNEEEHREDNDDRGGCRVILEECEGREGDDWQQCVLGGPGGDDCFDGREDTGEDDGQTGEFANWHAECKPIYKACEEAMQQGSPTSWEQCVREWNASCLEWHGDGHGEQDGDYDVCVEDAMQACERRAQEAGIDPAFCEGHVRQRCGGGFGEGASPQGTTPPYVMPMHGPGTGPSIGEIFGRAVGVLVELSQQSSLPQDVQQKVREALTWFSEATGKIAQGGEIGLLVAEAKDRLHGIQGMMEGMGGGMGMMGPTPEARAQVLRMLSMVRTMLGRVKEAFSSVMPELFEQEGYKVSFEGWEKPYEETVNVVALAEAACAEGQPLDGCFPAAEEIGSVMEEKLKGFAEDAAEAAGVPPDVQARVFDEVGRKLGLDDEDMGPPPGTHGGVGPDMRGGFPGGEMEEMMRRCMEEVEDKEECMKMVQEKMGEGFPGGSMHGPMGSGEGGAWEKPRMPMEKHEGGMDPMEYCLKMGKPEEFCRTKPWEQKMDSVQPMPQPY